ncbi:AEL089Cp [Eremothecium gossypii ATCC 10895]|uniref:AEL089Cp n=1 Tax=Eremothecium gossypii (strain ATCC 10895 / CBS 109.51 / FGSC 9923 / NRRL Y-1056) TaxID=284811 RepID=Q757V1_EREGS|nr:AEL089Cp [Eremothecium gossypii ATCC 10895]AAS52596.2 AEL089Cp [Eremothecium gossypii ATCC 10895]
MEGASQIQCMDSNYTCVFGSYNTTTVNLVLGLPGMFSTFTSSQLLKLRILAITASAVSIIAGIIGLEMVACIDRRRKVFRHHMVMFLIVFDLLKAIVLLVYPVTILINNGVYATPAFFNVVGWLTAYAIEGADIAIVIFAIHFGLLIFRPNWKWPNPTTGNMEGGFYKCRRFMYPIAGLLPMLLASLAFIGYDKKHDPSVSGVVILDNNTYHFPSDPRVGGYKPMSAWCYLPPYPYWYKLVLSWGPRYVIFVSICGIYVSIYVYVSSKSQRIKSELGDFHQRTSSRRRVTLSSQETRDPPKTLQQRVVRSATYFADSLGLVWLFRTVKNFFLLTAEDEQFESDPEDSCGDEEVEDFYHGVKSLNYDEEHLAPTTASDGASLGDGILPGPLGSSTGRHFLLPPTIANAYGSNTEGASRVSSAYAGDNAALLGVARDQQSLNSENDVKHKPSLGRRESFFSNRSSCSRKFPKTAIQPLSPILSPSAMHVSRPLPVEMFEHNMDMKSAMASLHEPLHQYDYYYPGALTDLKKDIHSDTYKEFKRRRYQIRKQLKSLFIYPFAYLVVWLFPFIVDCTHYRYELRNGPIIWLAYIATFMQPLNCLVDVFVASYRERPWRYTWSSIEKKEILNKYLLKGELGEQTIMELVNSDLGRRGWYYRGRWMKRECWRHKPSRWKRACWYVYRTVKGFIKNDYDFTDNCNDHEYWEKYYTLGLSSESSYDTRKNTDNDTNPIGMSGTCPREANTAPVSKQENEIIRIPIYWRIIHCHPMMRGIDLDELDRKIRLKSKEYNFVTPGLHAALTGSARHCFDPTGDSYHQISDPSFPPNYSIGDGNKGTPASFAAPSDSGDLPVSLRVTAQDRAGDNVAFSDETNDVHFAQGTKGIDGQSVADSGSQMIDLLSFLKGHEDRPSRDTITHQ